MQCPRVLDFRRVTPCMRNHLSLPERIQACRIARPPCLIILVSFFLDLIFYGCCMSKPFFLCGQLIHTWRVRTVPRLVFATKDLCFESNWRHWMHVQKGSLRCKLHPSNFSNYQCKYVIIKQRTSNLQAISQQHLLLSIRSISDSILQVNSAWASLSFHALIWNELGFWTIAWTIARVW